MNNINSYPSSEQAIVKVLRLLEERIVELGEKVSDMHSVVVELAVSKEWYTTAEIAAMMGVTRHTVQERWCNAGRIECEKDPITGKWRIPGHEYERLRRGGRPDGVFG